MSCRINRLLIRPLLLLSAVVFLLTGKINAHTVRRDEQSLPVPEHRFDAAAMRRAMLLDGISPGAVEVLLRQHEQLLLHGGAVSLLSRSSGSGSGNTICISCQGIGVENGWSNWSGYEGFNDNLGLTFGMPGNPLAPRFDITGGTAIDPLTPGPNPGDPPIPVVAPGFGAHSIRLGEPNTPGYGAERLVFPFTVGTNDTSFIYSYAFVMENPSNITPPHNDGNMPYVEFMIIDQSGDTIDCAYRRYQANESFPGQYSCNGPGQAGSPITPIYKPWTNVGVNLSAYIGQNLTVVITNADCQLGGHFAYSYWDFSCGAIPTLVRPNCQQGIPDTLVAPASEINNPYTYRWFRNGDSAPIGTSQSITPLAAAGDTFHVEITTSEGCRWYMFYIPQPYSIDAGFTYSALCGDVTFVDLSSVPSGTSPVTSWSWVFDNGSLPGRSGQTPGVVHFEPGQHLAWLMAGTAGGCQDTASVTFLIPEPPAAALSAPNVCSGDSSRLINRSAAVSGDPIVSYEWLLPDGAPDVSTQADPQTIFTVSGLHDVRLTIVTQSGCRDTAYGQAKVLRPPVPSFSGTGEACVPYCAQYFDASASEDGQIVSWSWNFPGGLPANWQGSSPRDICYSKPGRYDASLKVVTEYGCSATTLLPGSVIAHEKPDADFSVSPLSTGNAQPVFDFTDQSSENVVRWVWDFGDGTPVDDSGPIVRHSYSGSVFENDFYRFATRLFITTRYGCTDTVLREVTVEPDFAFFIPSAFTPDGDGINNFFFGKGRGIKEYECFVFDRWGLEIWSCKKSGMNVQFDRPESGGLPAECQWDGYYEGAKVQQDVYVWLVRLEDVYGRRNTYTGRVSVVY